MGSKGYRPIEKMRMKNGIPVLFSKLACDCFFYFIHDTNGMQLKCSYCCGMYD